ncbi:MAG: AbrB family transcriptional regulator [Burkholderiales bacterium]
MPLQALCASPLARFGGLAISIMLLATAPGVIAEMCIGGTALQLGMPLVTAAHITRVLMLVTTTAPLSRLA